MLSPSSGTDIGTWLSVPPDALTAILDDFADWSEGRTSRTFVFMLGRPEGEVRRLIGHASRMGGNKVLVGAPQALADLGVDRNLWWHVESEPPDMADGWAVVHVADGGPVVLCRPRGHAPSVGIGFKAFEELASHWPIVRQIVGEVRELSVDEVVRLSRRLLSHTHSAAGEGQAVAELVCQAWLGRLVRDMAHEFLNVLGRLTACIDMARMDTGDSAVREMLQSALDIIGASSTEVKRVFEVARARPPALSPAMASMPLDSALALMAARLGRRQIAVARPTEASDIITVDQAQTTLLLVRAIELLWESAAPGDTLTVRSDRVEGPPRVRYRFELGRVGAGGEDAAVNARPNILGGASSFADIEAACMATLADRNGAEVSGPVETPSGLRLDVLIPIEPAY